MAHSNYFSKHLRQTPHTFSYRKLRIPSANWSQSRKNHNHKQTNFRFSNIAKLGISYFLHHNLSRISFYVLRVFCLKVQGIRWITSVCLWRNGWCERCRKRPKIGSLRNRIFRSLLQVGLFFRFLLLFFELLLSVHRPILHRPCKIFISHKSSLLYKNECLVQIF